MNSWKDCSTMYYCRYVQVLVYSPSDLCLPFVQNCVKPPYLSSCTLKHYKPHSCRQLHSLITTVHHQLTK